MPRAEDETCLCSCSEADRESLKATECAEKRSRVVVNSRPLVGEEVRRRVLLSKRLLSLSETVTRKCYIDQQETNRELRDREARCGMLAECICTSSAGYKPPRSTQGTSPFVNNSSVEVLCVMLGNATKSPTMVQGGDLSAWKLPE
jgi:hypothetical protein